MDSLGVPEPEGGWIFEYRRCRVCGFTVRLFLRYVPDDTDCTDLRRRLNQCRLSGVAE
jgi:hypothetical protein